MLTLTNVNDWIIVKFMGKQSVRRFVVLVTDRSDDDFTIKFAPRIDTNRFKWPEVDDISVVNMKQIESKLGPPQFCNQIDRVTSFLLMLSNQHKCS